MDTMIKRHATLVGAMEAWDGDDLGWALATISEIRRLEAKLGASVAPYVR